MPYLKKQLDGMRIDLYTQPKKISPEPVCDFCGSENPLVVYASSSMSTGELRNCWRWAACGVCEALVDRDQWREVELRIENRLIWIYRVTRLPIPEDLIQYAVKGALNDFHRHAIKI